MSEITERFQFIVDMRHEIYVDNELVEVNTESYNSLNTDSDGSAVFTIKNDIRSENTEAIDKKETAADDIFTAEISEIEESLTKKGVTLNPDANPFDPGERNDEDDGGSDDDDSGSDNDSDDKHFTDPGDGGSDIPER